VAWRGVEGRGDFRKAEILGHIGWVWGFDFRFSEATTSARASRAASAFAHGIVEAVDLLQWSLI